MKNPFRDPADVPIAEAPPKPPPTRATRFLRWMAVLPLNPLIFTALWPAPDGPAWRFGLAISVYMFTVGVPLIQMIRIAPTEYTDEKWGDRE